LRSDCSNTGRLPPSQFNAIVTSFGADLSPRDFHAKRLCSCTGHTHGICSAALSMSLLRRSVSIQSPASARFLQNGSVCYLPHIRDVE
jgi:hypothetical protein